MSKRTKMILCLSTLPLILVVGGAAWAVIYPFYLNLKGGGHTSYFIAFHVRLLRLLAVTMVLLICGLISLLFDRQINGTK
ncbi:MAG: hypothetical protein WBR10_14345 [Candidatus Acidiferrum sp.]